MEENTNGGNETTDNVELVKVGEHEVSMKTLEDGKVEIESPDGLEDDKDFQDEVVKVVSAMGKANQKGFQTNKRQKELDEQEVDLKRRESEFQLKATQGETLPSLKELTMKHLDITNDDDLEDVSPSELLTAQEKAMNDRDKLRNKSTDNRILVADFITKGGDYNALLTFANSLGAPVSKALINQFTKTNETKQNFSNNNLANLQGSQISFVSKGGSTPTARSNKADNILKAGKAQKEI